LLLTPNKRLRQALGILETGNLLFLKLMLKNREGASMFPGEVFRKYMSLVGEDQWKCCSIFEALPELRDQRITIEHQPSDAILTPLEQLAALAFICRATARTTVFEIGTFRGRTALNFALNSPDDCTIYTLDLPPDDRAALSAHSAADKMIVGASRTGVDYEGKDVSPKIKQLYGDSTKFDYAPFFGKVDLVYVDGAHHYEVVESDTKNALKMVRPGGMIAWDEFANYGDYNDITRAVLDTIPADQVWQIENTQIAVYRAPLS
jgi:predicted O-methyltransferase YrrM